jgi:hypothetical protein
LQQQLPHVVKQTVLAGGQRLGLPDDDDPDGQASVWYALASLGWVLSTAGPAAVGTAAVAETLLRLSTRIPKLVLDELPGVALQHGLQLTVQLVVDLSQQRVKFLHVWLAALGGRLLQEQQQQQGQNQKGAASSFSPRHFNWLCIVLVTGQPVSWSCHTALHYAAMQLPALWSHAVTASRGVCRPSC